MCGACRHVYLRGDRCEWLQFGHLTMEDGHVGAAWLFEKPVTPGAGLHIKATGIQLHSPPGWEFEGSLSQRFVFVPASLISDRRDN